MATKATRITSTKEVPVVKMVPTTVMETHTVTTDVAMLVLNMRSRGEYKHASLAFTDMIEFMQQNGVDFTIRIKASKMVDPAGAKALKTLNNALIRYAKAANVPARKNKPDTPTAACNNCVQCTND